ncbi:putative ABC1 serine/threonine-protein kinase [Hamiltosporidium magnivora]|uniref:Putative ABC1 serine/threonine-protein kinase n=1 Tax=Hamiltosporidium magnivora TaxID=148818 RepID=A0A4V2JWR5_9MICR|nr:putative ABC1 serine/threonine-protein kinase [Hamiltosporidium magnivora]
MFNIFSKVMSDFQYFLKPKNEILKTEIMLYTNNRMKKPSKIYILLRTTKTLSMMIPVILSYKTPLFKYFVNIFVKNNGYLLMKSGQWISTRPDIFSKDLIMILSELQYKAPFHSLKYSKRIIQEEIKNPEEILDFLQFEPIGSGCVAQVYKTKYKNKPVALKILHPNIKNILRNDFYMLEFALKFLKPILKLDYSSELRFFYTEIKQQLNLKKEHRNMEILRNNFSKNRNLIIPKPIFSTKNILVEEYIEAKPLFDVIKDNKVGCEIKSWLFSASLDFIAQMIFKDKFIHSDLHPGNIYVKDNNGTYQLVLFDYGLCKRLNKTSYKNLFDLSFELLISKNGKKAASLLLNRLEVNKYLSKDKNEFKSKINILLNDFIFKHKVRSKNVSSLTFNNFALKFLESIQKHNVRLDPTYSNLILSMVCFSGIFAGMYDKKTFVNSIRKNISSRLILEIYIKKLSNKLRYLSRHS